MGKSRLSSSTNRNARQRSSALVVLFLLGPSPSAQVAFRLSRVAGLKHLTNSSRSARFMGRSLWVKHRLVRRSNTRTVFVQTGFWAGNPVFGTVRYMQTHHEHKLRLMAW